MVDLATELPTKLLARAANEADRLEAVLADDLRLRLDAFSWPELRLVVEADGLRYHRTPSAQARDARRDQAHTAAGFARLRFTHHQVKYERAYAKRILGETTARLK